MAGRGDVRGRRMIGGGEGRPTVNRDLFAGPVMVVAGSAFAFFGQDYHVGTLGQMGPGFVPVALGLVLAGIGLLITVGGFTAPSPDAVAHGADHGPVQPPDWRGLVAIVLGVLSFILLGERGGMAMAAFAVVFISALGDRNNRLRDAVLLAAGMTVVAVAVFYYGLQIRLPLLPEWLS